MAAARTVLSTPSDGYTLAMLTNGTAISVPLFKSLSFDPAKDFMPISNLGNFDFIFATGTESGFRTLADFLKAAREKPGSLNVGTIAVGSSQNLSAELLKTTANVNFVIVPYRATPDLIVGAIRGETKASFCDQLRDRRHLLDRCVLALGPDADRRRKRLI
jgi:tripartite-type tricarboxylate transporter receptor subunit TctC